MNLTPTQRAILTHLYKNGDNIAANIADDTGYHRNSLSRSFPDLVEKGLVRDKGRGVYELTKSGRSTARELLKDD